MYKQTIDDFSKRDACDCGHSSVIAFIHLNRASEVYRYDVQFEEQLMNLEETINKMEKSCGVSFNQTKEEISKLRNMIDTVSKENKGKVYDEQIAFIKHIIFNRLDNCEQNERYTEKPDWMKSPKL